METIGRYTILDRIGTGGMAEVFLAKTQGASGTSKTMVLKKIHPTLAKNSRFIDMFIDEAHVVMRLNHSNIVQVYAFEQIDDVHILSMEYIDGLDLMAFSKCLTIHNQRIPCGLAAYIVAEAARGLDYAHSRRNNSGRLLEIVHRDVSPQNILLSREGAVKITDFGVARAKWRSSRSVDDRTLIGKLGYMAPEQASGLDVDRRTDVFALGMVFYELLTGKKLVPSGKRENILPMVQKAEYTSAISIFDGVPDSLNNIVKKAMAKAPEDRFQTARQMARALLAYLHTEEEIFDAQILEQYIQKFNCLPDTPLSKNGDSSFNSTVDEITKVFEKTPHLPAKPAMKDSELKQAVLVFTNVERKIIPPHILLNMDELLDNIAYRAQGVLSAREDGYKIFLGLLHTSPEDSRVALRLAYDIEEALKALFRDYKIEKSPDIFVTRTQVHLSYDENKDAGEFKLDDDFFSVQSMGAQTTQELINSIPISPVKERRIFADDSVYHLTRQEYHFETIKNDNSIVPGATGKLYRAIRARTRKEQLEWVSKRGTFVERKEEMTFLSRVFKDVSSSKTAIIAITGETGIGKSRLKRQFLDNLASNSPKVSVIEIQCLFGERGSPLAGAAAALRSLLKLDEDSRKPALKTKLENYLSKAPNYFLRQNYLFNSLLERPEELWSKYKGGKRELIRRIAFGIGVCLGLMARKTTTVICVENAQWLDSPSIDILSELASANTSLPIMVMIVGNMDTLKGRKISKMETITLGELSDESVLKIVRERFGSQSSDSTDEIISKIVLRSQGNPFFTNEIIDSLIERGILKNVIKNNRQVLKQVSTGEVKLPATMEGIASSRIDKLTKSLRAVLRTASAIGSFFTFNILDMLTDLKTRESVLKLEKMNFFIFTGLDKKGLKSYRFSSPMVREVAYGGLHGREKVRIHKILVARLIEKYDKGQPVSPVRIAWHLDHLDERDKAGKYYLLAGDNAMSRYSTREALNLYTRAITHLTNIPAHRFNALAKREKLLHYTGRHKEQNLDLVEMGKLAKQLGSSNLVAVACLKQAQFFYDLGEFENAGRELEKSLKSSISAKDVFWQVESLRLLAYLAQETGHVKRSLMCCEKALGLITEDMPMASYLKARTLGIQGYILMVMGHLNKAAFPMAKALVGFRNQRKRRNESQVLSNLGLLAQNRGNLTEAVNFIQSAMRIDSKTRDVSARGRKLSILGSFLIDLGDFLSAEKKLLRALGVCQENNEILGEIEARLFLVKLNILTGQILKAKRHLDEVDINKAAFNSRVIEINYHHLHFSLDKIEGKKDEAVVTAKNIISVAAKAGMAGELAHGEVNLAWALSDAGYHTETVKALKRAENIMSTLELVRDLDEINWKMHLIYKKEGFADKSNNYKKAAVDAWDFKRSNITNPKKKKLFEAHPALRKIMNEQKQS